MNARSLRVHIRREKKRSGVSSCAIVVGSTEQKYHLRRREWARYGAVNFARKK